MRIPGEGTRRRSPANLARDEKTKESGDFVRWNRRSTLPDVTRPKLHIIYYSLNGLMMSPSGALEKMLCIGREGRGGRKKRQNCVSGKRFDYREKCVSFDFGKRNRYSMTFHCEKHQKILLHFQFIGEGGGPIEARKLIAVWFCCSKEINDVWKAKQKLFPSQWIFILLFIFARGKKLFA